MSIYDEIAEEKAAHDTTWGPYHSGDGHTVVTWVYLVIREAVKAGEGARSLPSSARASVFRSYMLRVAALAVLAIEATDREIALAVKAEP